MLVSDLDLECQLWMSLQLAPMCPWVGTISMAFSGPPDVKVQLSPYNRVRLMRVPVVQVGQDDTLLSVIVHAAASVSGVKWAAVCHRA